MTYTVKFKKQVKKDLKNLKAAHLDKKFFELIECISENPFNSPPPFKHLQGQLEGLYSRRLNIKHRLLYSVEEEKKQVIVWSAWTHYERKKQL